MLNSRFAAVVATGLVCTALTAPVMNHRVNADPAPIERASVPSVSPLPFAPVLPVSQVRDATPATELPAAANRRLA